MNHLVTDHQEIARLSKRKERENISFRAKLKMNVRDEDRLDAKVHALYKEISAQIDCRSCGACCKHYDIIVNDIDIERLAKDLKISAEEFRSLYVKKASDEVGLCFNTKPCPFQKDNVCTRYDARPDVCREYPHLDKDGFLGHTLSAIGNCHTCPIVFNVWEALKRSWKSR